MRCVDYDCLLHLVREVFRNCPRQKSTPVMSYLHFIESRYKNLKKFQYTTGKSCTRRSERNTYHSGSLSVTKLINDAHDVRNHRTSAVIVDALELGGGVIAPQIGCNHMVSCFSQRLKLVLPNVPEVREAVNQNHLKTGSTNISLPIRLCTRTVEHPCRDLLVVKEWCPEREVGLITKSPFWSPHST